MTERYELTGRARDDLASIGQWTQQYFGSRQALRLHDQFTRAFEQLAEHPRIGHERHDIPSRFGRLRFWPVMRWQIGYEITEFGVRIVRVIDGSRDLRAAFEAE